MFLMILFSHLDPGMGKMLNVSIHLRWLIDVTIVIFLQFNSQNGACVGKRTQKI